MVLSSALLVALPGMAPAIAAPRQAYTLIKSGEFWGMCRDRELDTRKEHACTNYLLGQIDAAVTLAARQGPKLCMDFGDRIPTLIDQVLDHVPADMPDDQEITPAIQAAILKALAC
ncbi:hypothetical protein [Mesorhizobium sp.]|uniref:hypothetical protein n=1 Tax=Mesorhizobium sp. TaxID=1871066 RepID=UPI003BACDCD4